MFAVIMIRPSTEQQMVVAEQDVLDTERQIAGGDIVPRLHRRDRRLRRGGCQPLRPGPAVQEGYTHQSVRDSALQPGDADVLATQRRQCPHLPCLHHRITRDVGHDRRDRLNRAGKYDVQRQTQFAEHWRLEQHREGGSRLFGQFKIGRPDLVRGTCFAAADNQHGCQYHPPQPANLSAHVPLE
jgi:hypothetical protein